MRATTRLVLLAASAGFILFVPGAGFPLLMLCVFTGEQLWVCWGGLALVLLIVPLAGLSAGWVLQLRGQARGALIAGSLTLLYLIVGTLLITL